MNQEKRSRQQLAALFINDTKAHLFITGKAGTGKTTLLREIRQQTKKKLVVAAPTGVAAINAEGVTLHSLFRLPNELILPVMTQGLPFKTIGTLLEGLRLADDKERLLKEMEVLVIDEVSMMRADILDAIDHILRRVRGNTDPFGGVQMVFFGDLYQLPPVVSDGERPELLRYYRSEFFFDALVMQAVQPVFIELTEVFRQSDPEFLKLLHHIRNNMPDGEDLSLLTSRFFPDFMPAADERYVRLTSHRRQADEVNLAELEKLPGTGQVYPGSSSGLVDLKNLPVEQDLRLKLGAQVMFVKNDTAGNKRYFNGKIGTVSALSPNHIEVTFPDGQSLNVEQERWQTVQYQQSEETDTFSEVSAGEFVQYPLRLAWAITIHKSQGLTFDRAIVDAGRAFAPGQVYVALSRVRTLDGLVLQTPITRENLFSNPHVVAFAQRVAASPDPETLLIQAKKNRVYQYIRDSFRLTGLLMSVEQLPSSMDRFRHGENSHYLRPIAAFTTVLAEMNGVSESFLRRLPGYWAGSPEVQAGAVQRLKDAAAYFKRELEAGLIAPIKRERVEMLIKRAPKEIQKFYGGLERLATQRLADMEGAAVIWEDLLNGADPAGLIPGKKVGQANAPEKTVVRRTSSDTFTAAQKATLKLFQQGRTIGEIAAERNLAIQTVEQHITLFVGTGHIPIEEIILPEMVKTISTALNGGKVGIHEVKKTLGESVSYFQIRAVIAYEQSISVKPESGSGMLF